MAAGLGFKDFVTGEVLTAADVDGYLMQGIWVFASAAARSAAVTSPQEGNYSFLKDTNSTEYYDGSAWVAAGGGGGGGKILQVVSATYSTEAQNNTSTYADTGLTATITPTLSTSKILVTVHQTGIKQNESSVKIKLMRDATDLIVLEFEAGKTNQASFQNSIGGTGCTYLDTPATTSALTYKTRFLSVANVSYARVQQDGSSSTITLMEIGV